MSEEKLVISGRICEVGRGDDGHSDASIDLGRGEQIRVSGLSDATAKQLARNLYKHVRLEFQIYAEE